MTQSNTRRPAGELENESLELLYEGSDAAQWRMPGALAAAYGGGLGFDEPCVFANFVASLDGVVALGPEYPSSGSAISGREPADRFVMGLLRACADAVLVGAGTLRATPRHLWTPAHVFPAYAEQFAELRRSRGRGPEPELVVVTARGDLPRRHPALEAGAVVATTSTGARHLHGDLPPRSTVVVPGDGVALEMENVLATVRARGHELVLCEGGPRLLGQLVDHGLLDELFLTVSPVLAGRDDANGSRPGLIAGTGLLPGRSERAQLLSLRRHRSFLFLHYRMNSGAERA